MSKILFTPGPTNVPEEIRQVLGQDLIHHRMADYHQLLKEINEDLKVVFDTNHLGQDRWNQQSSTCSRQMMKS